jgi:hydrogenase/urease accessory protein HupE
MLRVTLIAVAVVAFAAPASAHPAPFSYLDIHLTSDRSAGASAASIVNGTLVVHVIDLAHDLALASPNALLEPRTANEHKAAIAQLLAPRLVLLANGRELTAEWQDLEVLPERQAIKLQVRFAVASAAGVIRVRCALFPYDPNHQTFLNVYEDGKLMHQGILERAHPDFDYYTGTRQGTLAVVERFIPSGIHHILVGPDHILFLVGLLLLGGRLRQLLLIVSSFTLAHSLTLSLATLNLLNPPARLIEPAIALSIVYVGADNLLVRDGHDLRGWIALTFGFVHGFGFASVLREIGLPGRALGWSLFSFNFGVEIGQVCIVMAVAGMLGWVRRQNDVLGRRVVIAGSLVVIGAGMFWFVERLFFPGGV